MTLRSQFQPVTSFLRPALFLAALFLLPGTARLYAAPVLPDAVRDGTSRIEDQQLTFSPHSLHANWDAAADPSSSVKRYLYCFGTAPERADLVPWTDNGPAAKVSLGALSLSDGTTYYCSVYAENMNGERSQTRHSNGVLVRRLAFKEGLRQLTPEQEAFLASRERSVSSLKPNALAMQRFRAAPSPLLGVPTSVKNTVYLPPIGNQGAQGSCAAWASCYYLKTYQEARENGWIRPDPDENPERVFSPAFGYNLNNYGEDGGSDPGLIMYSIVRHGCPTLQDMPYTDANFTDWPTESVWRAAIPYRAADCDWLDISTDEGIQALKQLLANGDLAVIGLPVYSNWYENYPNDAAGIDNQVLYANDGSWKGGHALTVIGYDDARSYRDGLQDKSGAFLVANSWGSLWGVTDASVETKGFMWISYDYLRNESYQSAYAMTDRIGYTSDTVGVVGLQHPARGDLSVRFIGGDSRDLYDWQSQGINFNGGDHEIDGNIVIDLGDVNANLDKPFWVAAYDSEYNSATGYITYMAIEKNGIGVSDLSISSSTSNGAYIYQRMDFNVTGDDTPPAPIARVDDGLSCDIAYTSDTHRLSANWTPTSDAESGIAHYFYAIGTTSGSADALPWTDNGTKTSVTRIALNLTPGSTYYFSVKAQNWSRLETGITSSNGQQVNLTVPYVYAVNDGPGADKDWSNSCSDLEANWQIHLAAGQTLDTCYYGIGTTPTNPSVTGWVNNGTAASLSLTGLSLAEGTTFFVLVKARNAAGEMSDTVSSDGFRVDKTPPQGIVILSKSSPLPTGAFSIDLAVQEAFLLAGPPSLAYVLSDGTTVPLALAGSGNVWSSASFIESGTPEGSAYFVFSATDAAGNFGSVVASGETFSVDTTVNAASGGTVSNSDGTSVTLPPNAAPQDCNILITVPSPADARIAAANTDIASDRNASVINAGNLAREFTATDPTFTTGITSFNGPLTITLSYPDADQNGVVDGTIKPESTLFICYLDEAAGRWVPLIDSAVNASANTVRATTTHLSIYTLISFGASTMNDVIVYPNPGYPARDGGIYFGRIPLNSGPAILRIYTISGKLVRTLDDDHGITAGISSRTGFWDGTNDSGEEAASGMYFYQIKTDRGSKIEKFAVFR